MGDVTKGSIARYRGHLIIPDSASAYDQLADSLKPYDIVPLFRVDHDQQTILPRSEETRSPSRRRVSINNCPFHPEPY